jgi:hypothetical protein
MMENTFTPNQVAQFISDEVTSGASLARKALLKNLKKPGSVSEKRRQYLIEGVIRDMILVGASEVVETVKVPELITEVDVVNSADNSLILEVDTQPQKKSQAKKVVNEDANSVH